MFKTNFSGRNKIWGDTKEIWGELLPNAPCVYGPALKYGPRAKSGLRIDFVNNEKLIDEKLFDLVECHISRNNHIS